MAKEQDDKTLDTAPLPPTFPKTNGMETVWLIALLNPNITSKRLGETGISLGMPQGSAYSSIAVLKQAGRLLEAGKVPHPNPKTGKELATFVACDKSRVPEVQAWLDEHFPQIVYRDLAPKQQPPRKNKSAPASTKAASAQKQFPPPPGASAVIDMIVNKAPPKAAPGDRVATEFPSRVFWKRDEVRAVCKKLASDSVLHGLSIDQKRFAYVATLGGLGYRPRRIALVADREKFLEQHKVEIMQLQMEVEQQPRAEQQGAQSEMPPAPPPHQEQQDEAERVAQATSELKLEIDDTPQPSAGVEQAQGTSFAAPQVGTALGLIVAGVKMLFADVVRDVVREEITANKALDEQRVGEITAAMLKMANHVEAASEKVSRAIASIETTIALRKLTHPDTTVLKQAEAPTPTHAPHTVQPEHKINREERRKPVVCVIGGNSVQIDGLKRAFGDRIDFRFYSGDRTPLEPDPKWVFGYTRFMAHNPQKDCKRKYGDRYVSVDGSLTTMKLAIAQRLGLPIAQEQH